MQALSLGRHCSMASSTTLCFSSAQKGKALLQIIDVPNRCLIDSFLYQLPDPIVNWIEVCIVNSLARHLVQWCLGFHVVAARWCPVHGVQVHCHAGIWRRPLTYAEYLATSAASFDLTSCSVSLRCILLAEYKTDRRTDIHMTTAYTALSYRRAVKTDNWKMWWQSKCHCENHVLTRTATLSRIRNNWIADNRINQS